MHKSMLDSAWRLPVLRTAHCAPAAAASSSRERRECRAASSSQAIPARRPSPLSAQHWGEASALYSASQSRPRPREGRASTTRAGRSARSAVSEANAATTAAHPSWPGRRAQRERPREAWQALQEGRACDVALVGQQQQRRALQLPRRQRLRVTTREPDKTQSKAKRMALCGAHPLERCAALVQPLPRRRVNHVAARGRHATSDQTQQVRIKRQRRGDAHQRVRLCEIFIPDGPQRRRATQVPQHHRRAGGVDAADVEPCGSQNAVSGLKCSAPLLWRACRPSGAYPRAWRGAVGRGGAARGRAGGTHPRWAARARAARAARPPERAALSAAPGSSSCRRGPGPAAAAAPPSAPSGACVSAR